MERIELITNTMTTMKKLLSLFILMLTPMLASAQTVLDVKDSGCLSETRGEEPQREPTIVLTKEGSVLSVQLLNYEGNCCTDYFNATYSISGGSDGGLCSVSINVAPVAELDCDCMCPFNVSFTIRDLEPNRFYLDCWWYKGTVNLKEGKPLVLDGQEREYYYYYKGKKIPLTLNEDKVVVNIPKEHDGISKRIRANVPVLSTIKDEVFDSFIIPRSDFEKLTSQSFWEEDAKSVVLTSSYLTEDNDEVFETPYLNVKLKKEEDAGLLDAYAEKYGLRNLGSFSQSLPLWYVLYVTPQSEKSPLQCANELYESGEFASSVPDLSSDVYLYPQMVYRPFIEEGKTWIVRVYSDNLSHDQWTEYLYIDGDTIINGQTAKRMLCDRVDSKYDITGEYVGAWYEQDKKVYFGLNKFDLLYDFTLSSGDSICLSDYTKYVVNKSYGGISGFKGAYYEFLYNGDVKERWFEGVGSESWPYINNSWRNVGHTGALLACFVGDEIVYYNSKIGDLYILGARKQRIDFTHTIKIKPKARTMREAEPSLYGEYSEQQLGINLNPLDDAYVVRITDEAGKTVYEKTVNAGSIVGLNIDISAYAKGRYTVTVENSNESFTGQFETQTTGIEENVRIEEFKNGSIYNLQGQRINSLRKGLNIVDGRKMFVK